MHECRIYRQREVGTVAICCQSDHVVEGGKGVHHLAVLQRLNKVCGHRHRKLYTVAEEERRWFEAQEDRAILRRVSDRTQTVEALNSSVLREYRR